MFILRFISSGRSVRHATAPTSNRASDTYTNGKPWWVSVSDSDFGENPL